MNEEEVAIKLFVAICREAIPEWKTRTARDQAGRWIAGVRGERFLIAHITEQMMPKCREIATWVKRYSGL